MGQALCEPRRCEGLRLGGFRVSLFSVNQEFFKAFRDFSRRIRLEHRPVLERHEPLVCLAQIERTMNWTSLRIRASREPDICCVAIPMERVRLTSDLQEDR